MPGVDKKNIKSKHGRFFCHPAFLKSSEITALGPAAAEAAAAQVLGPEDLEERVDLLRATDQWNVHL